MQTGLNESLWNWEKIKVREYFLNPKAQNEDVASA